MKKLSFLIICVLTFSCISYAGGPAELPETIICRSKAAAKEARSFEITKLNTESPKSTFYDTGLLEMTVENSYLVKVAFSNQCDNSYGLILIYEDLVNLKNKKTQKVTALLNYFNTDMENAETVSVECRLK